MNKLLEDKKPEGTYCMGDLSEMYGIHKQQVYQRYKAGKLPRPLPRQPGVSFLVWSKSEVDEHLRQMKEAEKPALLQPKPKPVQDQDIMQSLLRIRQEVNEVIATIAERRSGL